MYDMIQMSLLRPLTCAACLCKNNKEVPMCGVGTFLFVKFKKRNEIHKKQTIFN